jgi:hypothetical protein
VTCANGSAGDVVQVSEMFPHHNNSIDPGHRGRGCDHVPEANVALHRRHWQKLARRAWQLHGPSINIAQNSPTGREPSISSISSYPSGASQTSDSICARLPSPPQEQGSCACRRPRVPGPVFLHPRPLPHPASTPPLRPIQRFTGGRTSR